MSKKGEKAKKLKPGTNRFEIWLKLDKKKPFTPAQVVERLKAEGSQMNMTSVPTVLRQLYQSGWAKQAPIDGVSHYMRITPPNGNYSPTTTAAKSAQTAQTATPAKKKRTQASVRVLLLEALRTHVGIEKSRADITAAAGVSPKTSSVSTHLNQFVAANLIDVRRDGAFRHYTPLPAILNGKTPATTATPPTPPPQDIRQILTEGLPMAEELQARAQGYAIPQHVVDAQPMDVGAMVNQIVAVNQQNQMYRQAFDAILHIFEQINVVESD